MISRNARVKLQTRGAGAMRAVAAVRAFVSFNATLDGTRLRETPPFASDAMSSGVVLNTVMKGGDDLAAAHQPDILASLLSKMAHEWADCVHKLHA